MIYNKIPSHTKKFWQKFIILKTFNAYTKILNISNYLKNKDFQSIKQNLKKSSDLAPVIFLSPKSNHSLVNPLCSLNVLNWQFVGIQDTLKKLVNHSKLLECQLSMSDVLSIPVGNFEMIDDCEFIDHLMKREWITSNCVLGKYSDKHELDKIFPDLINESVSFNKPACVRSKTCHFEILGFVLNSIIQSNKILSHCGFDIYDSIANNQKENLIYDEMSPISSKSFKNFKNVISKLVTNCTSRECSFSARILENIYDWLVMDSIKNNKILKSIVDRLIKLQFDSLKTEISQFPINIIYFDQNTLIVTLKRRPSFKENLNDLFTVMSNNFRVNKIFHGVQFFIQDIYESLVWFNKVIL